MKKILYGVCGIGNGHAQRQLPLIEYFSKNCQIVILAYGNSLDFYSERFKVHPTVTVLEVAVPFYVGSKDGIDFEATKNLPSNNKDYDGVNSKAMTEVERILGIPNIVITDYEPISAKYAYKHNIPLITIDQQSKYLVGEFPSELNGNAYVDEVARLKMFFPTATARIACSFFNVTKKNNGEVVLMMPPIIKDSVLNMRKTSNDNQSVLVYFSSQKEFPQALDEVLNVCSSLPQVQFHVFTPTIIKDQSKPNMTYYAHGDKRFNEVLQSCSGIISTAGHTLLSEAMYLNIPVYAVPLDVYEQQMNAEVIDKNGFGIKAEKMDLQKLEYFLDNLSKFQQAIMQDEEVLLKGSGKDKIIEIINDHLLDH